MTYKPFIALAAALTLAWPAAAVLPVGAKAPDFSTQGSLAGKNFPFTLSQALKKGPVVLYFFPAAFTPGCTIEAHDFAEATADFNKAGATVIGVTAGNVDRLNEFSATECRNKFAVALASASMIHDYDVKMAEREGLSNRTSYVIAPDGKIIYAYSAMNPRGHVTNTLDAVKAWRAKK
ncbi:MAG: peroxiredoxin [Sphingomonas sp. SCN 67-18]|uniref:peroxiredoxin n=1 Tax=uncultured Sphingomonas sp. TaxID=158754 RepID=UPI00086B2454|nr:peroxiredoxin [Sphingomonas sp. SCN 67-18]ODU20641.1 MAG: peroxiredoxin [Sphingomonas sp. SCN 67-18]